jgi:hypothetical protein
MSRRLTPEQARELVASINRTVETLDRQHAEMREWLVEMAARLDDGDTAAAHTSPYRWPPR